MFNSYQYNSARYNHGLIVLFSETTPVLKEIKFSIASKLWENHPYSIQKIGRVVYFHNDGKPDPLITTEDEAKWRAKFELMNRLGHSEEVSVDIAPNYIHEAGDVIEIIDKENNVNGRYLIDSLTLPLIPDLMNIRARKEKQVIENWDFI